MVRGREKFFAQFYVFCDLLIIQISLLFTWNLRFTWFPPDNQGYLPFNDYFFWNIIYSLLSVLLGYVFSLYVPKRKKKFSEVVLKVIQIQLFSMFMLLSLLFIFKSIDVSRSFLVVYWCFALLVLLTYRFIIHVSLRSKGFTKQYVLIVGAGKLGRKYHDEVERHPEYEMDVYGFIDDDVEVHADLSQGYKPIVGTISDLQTFLNKDIIDEVIIALPIQFHYKYREIIYQCEQVGVRTSIIPDFYDLLPASPHFDTVGDLAIINVRDVPLDELRNKLFKRIFDIVFSVIVLTLTAPVLLLIMVVIKLSSRGPIIFKQERVGLNRRTFMMYKFRTMKHMPVSQSNTGWSTATDDRRTRLGTFLRKTSLDELPQFVNVLKGDMSVVGPRPERPYYVDKFKEEIPKYMIKHHVRPGITGWAQVNGLRGDTSIKDRIVHDIFYIEHWTLLFDIKIIFKTFISGFVNQNAY